MPLPSQSKAPMAAAAFMSTHGGLVPLGVTHSIPQFIYILRYVTTSLADLQGKRHIFLK